MGLVVSGTAAAVIGAVDSDGDGGSVLSPGIWLSSCAAASFTCSGVSAIAVGVVTGGTGGIVVRGGVVGAGGTAELSTTIGVAGCWIGTIVGGAVLNLATAGDCGLLV